LKKVGISREEGLILDQVKQTLIVHKVLQYHIDRIKRFVEKRSFGTDYSNRQSFELKKV